MLTIILEALGSLLEYELAVVLGLEQRERLVVRKASGPLAHSRFLDFSVSLSSRPDLEEILRSGKAHVFHTDEAFVDLYSTLVDLPPGHSCLAIPLSVDGEPYGLLTMDHRRCGSFTPKLVALISNLSKLIAYSLAQADAMSILSHSFGKASAIRADPFASLIGSSTLWRRFLEELRLVSATNATVLLQGETGTGKEEAALAIHRLSARASGPFIAVNCSSLTTGLADSELFGHERGAFTGSVGLRKGRFELADGGTLFLDEVADMPLEIQPKLLRALQSGSFERVGGERQVSTDIRVIAATNKDLEKEVAVDRFRRDLYYRLSHFPIHLPPLRVRGTDILLLAEHFLSQIRKDLNAPRLRFTPSALAEMTKQSWPGNVRELRNAVSRAAILAAGEAIVADHFKSDDRIRSSGSLKPGSDDSVKTWDDVSRDLIRAALEHSGGKLGGPGGAAELLGVKPTTLRSRMEKLGLRRTQT